MEHVDSCEKETLTIRRITNDDCGCASAPLTSLSPALLLALVLVLRRRRGVVRTR